MAHRYYNLPPLTTLAAFESAARHESFKSAAAELNVTPGAVSHQIKALEEELGQSLFFRRHRAVALTEEGKLLFDVLEGSFSRIANVMDQLRQASDAEVVTISATTAVSSLWLMPRLIAFWKSHGDVPVNQQISDQPGYAPQNADLQIRYGIIGPDDTSAAPLFRDELIPLCSPDFAEREIDPDLEELARMPLIHLDADDASWTTWQTWFRDLGYKGPITVAHRVNSFSIALQAARDGAGVVLGWRRLVKPYLDQQTLTPLGSHHLIAPAQFYIVTNPGGEEGGNAAKLRNWLLDNV